MKEDKTKIKILNLIKLNGSISQLQIAKKLGLTKMAISRQLSVLKEDKLINSKDVKQKVGRPVMMYTLSENSKDYFPNEHPLFSVSLIKSIKECAGENVLNEVLNYKLNKQISKYCEKILKTDSTEEKLKKLAFLRTNEGYMANVEKVSHKEYLFIENNCPISNAAESCHQICKNETSMLQNILGNDISIKRKEYILENGHRCAYQIHDND